MLNLRNLVRCLLIWVTVSCSGDNGLEDTPILNGSVGGESWTFQYGKANLLPNGNTYEVAFYSEAETASDPCAIVTTNNGHLRFTFPANSGNYNLPLNGTSVSFELQESNMAFQATSGFIEVIEIFDLSISGFLQANFDDGNRVEGQFRLKVCN